MHYMNYLIEKKKKELPKREMKIYEVKFLTRFLSLPYLQKKDFSVDLNPTPKCFPKYTITCSVNTLTPEQNVRKIVKEIYNICEEMNITHLLSKVSSVKLTQKDKYLIDAEFNDGLVKIILETH